MNRTILSLVMLVVIGCGKAAPAPVEDAKPVEKPLRCNPNIGEACDLEGLKFENAVGRPASLNSAARHYAAACDAGYGPGCTHLAGMYFEKEAMEQAYALYKRGCDAKDAEGCANLGFMESRAGNAEASRELYKTACEAGSMAACANLADVHQAGRGVDVDNDAARALFERSCAGGQVSSCIRWAWSVARGCKGATCATPAEDEKAAATITARACTDKGEPVVCTAYGVHAESGRHLPKDESASRAAYEKACGTGFPWACERLGTAQVRGLGGAKDAVAGVANLDRACTAGFAMACSSLGAMLLGGDGVARDDDRGGALVKRACELHEARACNTLRLLGL